MLLLFGHHVNIEDKISCGRFLNVAKKWTGNLNFHLHFAW